MTPKINGILILLGLFFIACNNPQTIKKEASLNTQDSAKANVSLAEKKAIIIVKNKSDYSEKFLTDLGELSGYQKFNLDGNLMIIDDQDSVYFPETPKMSQNYKLTAIQNKVAIAITVKRINFSSIEYSIEMVEFGKTKHNQSGIAHISASFFMGSESDENTLNGMTYFASEFIDHKENNCNTFIRLGYEDGKENYLLGKLIKNCNENIKDIDLDNFPTLIQK